MDKIRRIPDYTPFTPGSVVPLELFTGREKEVNEIRYIVGKSIHRNSIECIFVTGEVGIGKSSLVDYTLRTLQNEFDILGLNVSLAGLESQIEMLKRILIEMHKASIDRSWHNKVKTFLSNIFNEINLGGFNLNLDDAKTTTLNAMVFDFVTTICEIFSLLKTEKKGLILVLDNINGYAKQEKFAHWIKGFVEEFNRSDSRFALTMIFVGLPERREQLLKSQRSLDRVFNIVKVQTLDENYVELFFKKAFKSVNVDVLDEAMKHLVSYSSGYPVFMHEIGDSTFRYKEDNMIRLSDAKTGVSRAIELIGERYIESQILNTIRSEKYRSILNKISKSSVSTKLIKKELTDKLSDAEQKVLHNFLSKMVKLGVLRSVQRGTGNYEFTNLMYKSYFSLYNMRTQL